MICRNLDEAKQVAQDQADFEREPWCYFTDTSGNARAETAASSPAPGTSWSGVKTTVVQPRDREQSGDEVIVSGMARGIWETAWFQWQKGIGRWENDARMAPRTPVRAHAHGWMLLGAICEKQNRAWQVVVMHLRDEMGLTPDIEELTDTNFLWNFGFGAGREAAGMEPNPQFDIYRNHMPKVTPEEYHVRDLIDCPWEGSWYERIEKEDAAGGDLP